MKTQIPIYRAKRKDNDEYVKGSFFYAEHTNRHEIVWETVIGSDSCFEPSFESVEVDESTLAIHFPNMIDSEGTKIFASLSEDGKGGDKLDLIGSIKDGYAVLREGVFTYITSYKYLYGIVHWGEDLKGIGIKK